jgi:hypothetical protein
VNLLSAYQARLNGFMSRISNDNLKITSFNKDKNIVLEGIWKPKNGANTVSKFIRAFCRKFKTHELEFSFFAKNSSS